MPNERSTLTPHSSAECISDALKCLIACCQTELSEKETECIFSYLSTKNLLSQSDPETSLLTPHSSLLTAMASRHGILPLVYKTLKRLSESHSSLEHVLTDLKSAYVQTAQRNIFMSAELLKIMNLLKENNIEALAFKGPALAQMAYGDITLRQYADLDVLVEKEAIYKIDRLLKDRGYQRVLEMSPTQEEVYMKNAHDLGLHHPQSGVHFEMHWSLMSEDYPMQIDLADIWGHPQTVKINGKEISTFPTEELLLYLCIHGSKHLWERIEWIKDIDLLIRKKKTDGEEIGWEEVIERSQRAGFEKMVYLGLSLSLQLFNTPLPQNITQHIATLKVLDELSEFVLQSWQKPKSTFQQTAAMLKLFPGIKEKLVYLNTILIKPSLNEYWAVDLPKGLYWVYYLVRPTMLIKKYLTKQ